MSKESIAIYSFGGAATNIVSDLETYQSEQLGFANIQTYYADTSRSNLIGKSIPEDHVHIFTDKDGSTKIDGSGKVRATNFKEMASNVKSLLLKFKPEQFNIVVHSASGGTGAVLGHTVVSELKSRGLQVIVIVIGSTDTKIEIENTLKTLKSYEATAQKFDSPVVTYYVENSKETPRVIVNKQVKRAISLLTGLFSGENSELDTADLKNWLDYHKVSDTEPKLASLTFATNKEELENAGTVISVATLAAGDMDTRLEKIPSYQCVGFVPEVWRIGSPGSLQMIGSEPIHYCISDDFIIAAANSLNKRLIELDTIFTSRNARKCIIDKNDKFDSGIIL